ncbi:MAG: DNA replication complex GINS family protein [Asgard group archaeon]|nr:DNA replication complex GINS family protein [Asgard group archaeon]
MSEFDPNLEIQRIVFDFEEKPVQIKSLVDNPSIKIGKSTIKLIKGSEFEVPLWIARILEEDKQAEIKRMKKFDRPFMQSLLWDESKTTTLKELDPDFYSVVSLQIEKLAQKAETDPYALRDKERMEALLKDIISKRRYKIIKLSQTVGEPSPYIRNLTPEELWLFRNLKSQLQEWETSLINCDKNRPCF